MRPIHRALLGALLLCALLSLAACTTDGDKRKPLPGATETVLVEVPRRQLVRVSGELTAVPTLTPAPVPATPYGPNCTRRGGCYSNRQLEAMLNSALGWGEKMADSLHTIRGLMSEALNPKGNDDEAGPTAVPR